MNKMFNKLDETGAYKDLSNEELQNEFKYILKHWEAFLNEHDSTLELNKNYFIHKRNLFEVIKRVDKRKAYYYVFHKLDDVCEYKYIAIMCYWLCTLHPFTVIKEDSVLYNSPNEVFSLYLILAMLEEIYTKIYPDSKFEYPNERDIKDAVYNFKYCDLNREAFIFYVETLAGSYDIGLDLLGKMKKNFSEANI